MIEREIIKDVEETRILLRFTRTDDDGDLECLWAASTETGWHWKNGKRTPNRRWFTRRRVKGAHEFESVAWARRFSKIVLEFKSMVHEGWAVEVVEVTEKKLHTREIKPRWPADAVEALADLGRDVENAG